MRNNVRALAAADLDDRVEMLYQELVDEIRELDKDPLTTHEWSDVANDAYWQSGINNAELLLVLKNNLATTTKQGPKFVKNVYMILDTECVENIPSILNESTITAAEGIRVAARCRPHELMKETSPVGANARALIHYALTSPDYATVTRVIKERNPQDVEALIGIMKESERITAPLKNGAL